VNFLPISLFVAHIFQIRKDFFELLRENSEIDRHTHWMDIKKKLDKDPRYSAISDSVLREDYFYDYIKILKEERKKKKAKKSDKKEKKKKSKDKDRLSKDKSETATDKNGDNTSKVSSESTTEEKKEGDAEKSSPMEIDDAKSEDGSEKSDSDKDEEDGEHSGTDSETERMRKDRDRQARAEASIKQREQEVQRTLADNLRDRDKERQHHKRDESVRHFTALLADLVRNSDLTWKEVKKQLKKDHRWELVENLDREEKEKLFNDHIGQLAKKKRDKFREMLDETSLELTSKWKDVKRNVRDDPRFLKFGHSDRVSTNQLKKLSLMI
jgi:transcription elongation regulator 1